MCLPEFIEDMVSQDNPVRVIDSFVDSLDMQKLGFVKAQPAQTGRPAYDPRDLLKLYIYGYFNKIRSSRKLMQECARNIELFFLLNRLSPDFRTIADFRKDNSDAIRGVFLEFTMLCISLNLYSRELTAVDGSKFRAAGGNKQMYNQEILAKKLERISVKLKEYMDRLDREDQGDDISDEDDKEEDHTCLSEKVQQLQNRQQLYEGYFAELSETGQTQKLTTDPEARMMHSHKDGFHCCYNVQTAVDHSTHLINDYLVTNHINDQGILHQFSKQLKQTMGVPTASVVADKGYDSKEEIEACILNGIVPYVGFKDDKEERSLLWIMKNRTSPIKCGIQPIRKILVPASMQGCSLPAMKTPTSLSKSIRKGCWAAQRSPDQKTVICPMGFTLRKRKNKRDGAEYFSHAACRKCTNRCTPSKHPKSVYFGPETTHVAAVMYGNEKPLNTPPPGVTPHNSFFVKNRIEKTVLIRIRDDIPKQKERLCISEHPFGTVKWYHGTHYVLCKGIRKTTAELGLSFLAYNLRRAINLKGAIAIMEGIKA